MGPLTSLKVVELAGIGPGPFCAMLFADLGAEVIRVEHPTRASRGPLEIDAKYDLMNRGRRTLAVDLKTEAGKEIVRRLIARSDALIEGFRPGVCERLGLGPEDCWRTNERLVFGRVTGWGQSGPLSRTAGHDINYLALSGALHAIGPRDGAPVVPLNLVADFGGGGLLLAFGVLAAVLEARSSGHGQVVDTSMVEGVSYLMTMVHGMIAAGRWGAARGTNLLDGGAPCYDVYETKDGRYVAVGALEPRFYEALVRGLGLERLLALDHANPLHEAEIRDRLAAKFRTRTRQEWCDALAGTDACVSPVLTAREAPRHPHARERCAFVTVDGVPQPAVAPRFSRSDPGDPAPVVSRSDPTELLRELGYSGAQLDELRAAGVWADPRTGTGEASPG